MQILQFKDVDYQVIEKLYYNFRNHKVVNVLDERVTKILMDKNKWYLYALDNNIQKHILVKVRRLIPTLIAKHQENEEFNLIIN